MLRRSTLNHDGLSRYMSFFTQVVELWYPPRQHQMVVCTSRLEVDALFICRCYALCVLAVGPVGVRGEPSLHRGAGTDDSRSGG